MELNPFLSLRKSYRFTFVSASSLSIYDSTVILLLPIWSRTRVSIAAVNCLYLSGMCTCYGVTTSLSGTNHIGIKDRSS